MPTLPQLDIKTKLNHSPHVVILGAGASRACCPNGDRAGLKLPVMSDFIDIVGIADIIRKSGHEPSGNFEAIYDGIHRNGSPAELDELDKATKKYFGRLKLPHQPTLYDYLVLSLRPKDLIITFNWDPLLPQAYQRWRHLGAVLPQLAFLHGNVDIGVDLEKKVSGFLSDEPYPDRTLQPTRLLYPIEQKNYNTDPFIADQWLMATNFLNHAYYVTVYGYSAPISDVEARSLLLKAWQENTTRELAQINIVDIRDPAEVEPLWSDFIVHNHGGASTDFTYNILRRHPRRSCESFAFTTLQQQPWHEDPFPVAQSLAELEEWVMPLIKEEATGQLSGKPHH